MNLTPTIVHKTKKTNITTGITRIITRKTNQQATNNFTMYPSRATAIYNFIQYGIQMKNCNCVI